MAHGHTPPYGDVAVRKNADESRQRTLLPSSQRRSAAANRVLDRAILLPSRRKTVVFQRFPRTRPTFSGLASQWRVLPSGSKPFWSFPCAHSAVRGGFYTHVPFRLRSDEKSPLQHAATRRHRTQIVFNFPNFGLFISQSNILCEIECQPLRDKAFKTCW